MSKYRSYLQHPEFMEGLRDMFPQGPGVAAWGMMAGVAMAKGGLSNFEALLMALLVFAGSSQLAATPLIIAGAPAWIIIATSFCVNLRFIVFSLHLRPYLMHLPLYKRLVHGYLSTDISYVLFTRRFPEPATESSGRLAEQSYLAGSYVLNWTSWVFPGVAGVLLANFIPQHWGLGFAGFLSLIGILCSLASTRLRAVAALVGGMVAVAAYAMPLRLNIVVAILVATFLCVSLERRKAAP